MLGKTRVIKALTHKSWGADQHVPVRLCNALVRPIMDYGCIAYSLAKSQVLKTFDSIHNMPLRLSCGAFRTSPTHSILYVTKIILLGFQRKLLSFWYIAAIASTPNNQVYNNMFDNRLTVAYFNKPEHPVLYQRIHK